MSEGNLVRLPKTGLPEKIGSKQLEKIVNMRVNEQGVYESHFKDACKHLLAFTKRLNFRNVDDFKREAMKDMEKGLSNNGEKDNKALIKKHKTYDVAMDLLLELKTPEDIDSKLTKIAKEDPFKFKDIAENMRGYDDNVDNAVASLNDAVMNLAAWKFPEEFKAKSDERTGDAIKQKREELMKIKVSG